MLRKNKSIEPIDLFFALMTVVIAGAVAFILIGNATQSENVTVTVVGKDVNVSTDTKCATPTAAQIQGSCSTTTTRSYVVYTKSETFSVSPNIYYQIANKKYVFHVVGWPGWRTITQIIEEGK